MAKGKAAKKTEQDEGYLDFLGIGGEKPEGEGAGEKGETSQADQISGLMKTIEGLATTVDTLQQQVTMGATPLQATIAPAEPTLKAVNFEGLPDQQEDPAGFAKVLNTRMSETLQENMRVMGEFNTAKATAASAVETRTEQLWDDFQTQYMTKLETGLPDKLEALPYVEVAAKAVAKRAQRRGLDLDTYMYRGSFMADVFAETEKVLAPFRKEEGEGGTEGHPTAAEAEAHRTAGIFGTTGPEGKKPEENEDKGLISDLQEVQLKSGFY